VSLAVKTIKPNVEVVGVEPENVASFAAALEAHKPVYAFKEATLADGLAVPVVGSTSYNVAKRYVDKSVVVSEKLIALAMLRLIEVSYYKYICLNSIWIVSCIIDGEGDRRGWWSHCLGCSVAWRSFIQAVHA
jgi:threonine dehydratase